MNYTDTVNWMFAQLPMYQNKGKTAYKTDLSNTHLLANHLNHPEKKFKTVHVAGTNGKGSTSHMLASVLQEAGYKVGLYTSPHLKDYRERIKINGNCISEAFVVQFIKRNKTFFESKNLSFFEMTVGLAFDYFAKEEVDIAIIEVGLGGRLDSTNIISPEVSVITNIGLDHTQFLGTTIAQIAKEKGGIIKKNTPIVIGEFNDETMDIFGSMALATKSPIYYASSMDLPNYSSDLIGDYQKHNIKTALQTLEIIKTKGFKVSESNIQKGLNHVVKNTGLLGRWQILQLAPKIICDTAHNIEGLSYTLKQLENEVYKKLHIVIGVVNDKNLSAIVALFPKQAAYYFCKPKIERGLAVEKLAAQFAEKGYKGAQYNSVNEALNAARNEASKDDVIYVGGSTFVVAEII